MSGSGLLHSKSRRPPGPGFFAAEAAGLRWINVAGGPPVPAVHAVSENGIELDRITTGPPTLAAAQRFGRELGVLHSAGAPSFGAAPPDAPSHGWIGDLPMQYASHPDFASFWAQARIAPTAQAAARRGGITSAAHREVAAFCDELAAGGVDVGPPCPPARLHGDLWSGNVLWDAHGRVWLIDPAAHGGHPHSDLAMLALFGAPHLETIFAAYEEATAAPAGWRQRLALHQLWPLLVHAALFGPSYGAQAMAALRAVRRDPP